MRKGVRQRIPNLAEQIQEKQDRPRKPRRGPPTRAGRSAHGLPRHRRLHELAHQVIESDGKISTGQLWVAA